MSQLGPPIIEFDTLKPVTMTIIASLNVTELNLPAIFGLLPVTKQTLPPDMRCPRKQGKMKLPPQLNKAGEIISMRWNKHVRGIRRSEVTRSFPHSIIIDIGTSIQIVSLKLSRTIELTGARSDELAREASESIISLVKQSQEGLDLVRAHLELAHELQEKFLKLMAQNPDSLDFEESFCSHDPETDESKENLLQVAGDIWKFYQRSSGTDLTQAQNFFDFLNQFQGNLYTGNLELGKLEYEMVNIHSHLNYAINQVNLVEVMNSHPFVASFNTLKSSPPVTIHCPYTKINRDGKSVKAKHTIQVNRSGHVRLSGPNLDAMRVVYYEFIKRTLEHYEEIVSKDPPERVIQISGTSRKISMEEWMEKLSKERKLRQMILDGEIPNVTDEKSDPQKDEDKSPPKIHINMELNQPVMNPPDSKLPLGIVRSDSPDFGLIRKSQDKIDSNPLNFDYQPILAAK